MITSRPNENQRKAPDPQATDVQQKRINMVALRTPKESVLGLQEHLSMKKGAIEKMRRPSSMQEMEKFDIAKHSIDRRLALAESLA